MLFNSPFFAIFLIVVFIIYWFVTDKNLKVQNTLLLISSYYFYSCWDWRFLFLLIFSTLLDYFGGIQIAASENSFRRKFWLWLSISINVGFLGFFKYFNFFSESLLKLTSDFGLHLNSWTLQIILPVGISFYTFHGLSYIIDIYKRKIEPEKDFVNYAVFVSFFPLLVAGPIERATHLLPQIKKRRTFDYTQAVSGLKQILWGLFKKMVIADNCAVFSNMIFNDATHYSGSAHLLGALFFTFQIYCDFSGYSDIALGVAKLFGIELLRNFSYPYFSRDIAEFWRRWHISLSSWFKDYLYIPLGGSRGTTLKVVRNTFIIFLVSGFWHGANWTFLFWGFLNALYILPSILFRTNRNNLEIVAKGKSLPSLKDFIAMIVTFSLTAFAWIFFRSPSIKQGFSFVSKIFSKSLFTDPNLPSTKWMFFSILFFLIVEWMGREHDFALSNWRLKVNVFVRWGLYSLITLSILSSIDVDGTQFIYFQF